MQNTYYIILLEESFNLNIEVGFRIIKMTIFNFVQ